MKSKFFRVTCKCGHVGRGRFVKIDFPINAENKKEASMLARQLPRVKHDHKDAILACREIDYEEYRILIVINNNDPYLKCKNKQQQREIANLGLRIEEEPNVVVWKKNKRASVEYKNKKSKIVLEEFDNEMRGDYYGIFAY